MSEQLCDLPAFEIAQKVRSGELKATEVLESVLARMDQVEGKTPSSTYDATKPTSGILLFWTVQSNT